MWIDVTSERRGTIGHGVALAAGGGVSRDDASRNGGVARLDGRAGRPGMAAIGGGKTARPMVGTNAGHGGRHGVAG